MADGDRIALVPVRKPLPARRLNVAGQRYGRLTGIEFVGTAKHKKTVWRWRCDCGAVVDRLLAYVRRGDTTSCGCHLTEVITNRPAVNRLPEGEASFNDLINRYRNSARNRGHTYNLDRERFRELTKMRCAYCGAEPSQRHHPVVGVNGAYVYMGIDRIDNDKGYEEGNVVPCCGICNRSKGTMTQAEFVAWLHRASAWLTGGTSTETSGPKSMG
jgi:hypothetical protein